MLYLILIKQYHTIYETLDAQYVVWNLCTNIEISATSWTMSLHTKRWIYLFTYLHSEVIIAISRLNKSRLCTVTYLTGDAVVRRLMLQPVGFVTFSSRDSAEAARQALQVNCITIVKSICTARVILCVFFCCCLSISIVLFCFISYFATIFDGE